MNRRGFTLLETLLALSLILLLFGAMYVFSDQVATSRKKLEVDAGRQRHITDLFDSIERASLTSVAGDRSIGAGVNGSGGSLSIITRSGRSLVRWSWKLDESTGRLSVAATPVAVDQAVALDTPAPEMWADGLGSLRFRFFIHGQWTDTFDSLNAATLPDAIEVSAWLAPDEKPDPTKLVAATERVAERSTERPADRRRIILLDPLGPGGGT